MGLTRLCLKNPAAVGVMLAVIALLGVFSASRLPLNLLPNIERPVLGVWTGWRAAGPREVEAEIIEPIERELRGLPGIKSMQSWSNSGGGFVRLEFTLGTDMDAAFTEVTSRLQRVRGLPAEADRPAITFNGGGGNQGETLIFLFLQRLPGAQDINQKMSEFVRDRVAPELESVPGVAGVQINSNEGEEIVRVAFDPYLAAQLGISLDQISATVNRSSDVTGGSVEVGRRNYTMRFEGRFSAEELENTILAWRGGAPVRLGDIAAVAVDTDKGGGVAFQNGNPAIGMNVIREPGANTLVAIDAITEKLEELNNGPLAEMGFALHKSFDPSLFIKQAISLLTGNLLAGVILAVGVLWLFIRRITATLLIGAAIPVCLASTIVLMGVAGRSINVISLAGLAFATGMVLDAAIVVMENFVRMRDEGRDPMGAAAAAAGQVFGALFASTVTTVAVFVPILFFEDVEGQLFADLALTIAVAVAISLIVAVTVLPTGAAFLMKKNRPAHAGAATFVERVTNFIMTITSTPRRRWAWIAGLTVVPVAVGWMLFPPLNYLPQVKRAAIDGFIGLPSGANEDLVREEIAEVIIERLDPYMKGEKQPALLNYYIFAGPWGANVGIRAKDVSKLPELEKIVNEEILSGFPDTRVFAAQGNLFGNFGGGASMQVELQAADFDALSDAVPNVIDIIQRAVPGSNVWPNPDPQIVNPEIRILPNDRRIAEVGMTRDAVARAVRALGDGVWLGEFFHQGDRIDLYLQSNSEATPESLADIPIATPSGVVVPLGELATISRGVGPQQIRRLDGRRTIALGINAPPEMPLGDVVNALKEGAEKEIYAALPPGSSVKYAGEADSLTRAIKNLSANFGLAVAILFLILAALFKSIRDSVLVIIALPMAAVGGIIAVRLMNLISPAPLDLLGMIGFIILLGLVVNNAILLVSQARASEAEGFDRRSAVREALRLRVRPIFLTTLTSIMGMLPLVIAPGAGAAIYRGLATVIVGGMSVSTLFTLVLLPSLMQIGARRERTIPEPSSPVLQPAE